MVALSTTPNTLVTTYLEMTSRNNAPVVPQIGSDVQVKRMDNVDVKLYRRLYKAVGEKYRWRDRLIMPASELQAALNKATTHVFVLYVEGHVAGYVELDEQGSSTEIAYFGLIEDYHGRGLGKFLLSFGINKAWELGAERVFVHTCNLDGPHALANYKKRGFKVYEEHREPMPEIYQ